MFDTLLTPNWWQCIPPCFLIGLWAILLRRIEGSWMAPGAAWAAFWFLGTLVPLTIAADFPVYPSAVWVILLFTIAIGAGSTVGTRLLKPSRKQVLRPVGRLGRFELGVLMLLSLIAAWGAARGTLAPLGASLSSLAEQGKLTEVAQAVTANRYHGEEGSAVVTLLSCYIYFSCLVGGWYFATAKNNVWMHALTLLPLLASFTQLLLTTGKTGFLLSSILWISAYAASLGKRLGLGAKATSKPRSLLFAAIGVCAGIGMFYIGSMLRHGSLQLEEAGFFRDEVRVYAGSHLSVFSNWWVNSYGADTPLQWGCLSFFGPAAKLGFVERTVGVYAILPGEGDATAVSNIFTIYRGLIEDFSLPIALLVMAGFGFGAGSAFRNVSDGRPTAFRIVLLTAFYVTLAWGHVINPFGFTSIILALTVYCGFLLICSSKPTARETLSC